MTDSLGDRIKQNYEDTYRLFLPARLPLVLRIDGRSFHAYTKGLERPFDERLIDCLNETAIYLCQQIQGTKLAYLQSDEISLLIYQPDFHSQVWFGGNLQKMVSVAAGMASAYFTSISNNIFVEPKLATFDCRAFIVPLDEVVNTFEWRQQDATRNSIQMVARANFSHKQCNDKTCNQLQEMLFQEKGINWNDLPISQKRGRCIIKQKATKPAFNHKTGEEILAERMEWVIDNEPPIFHLDRSYIERLLTPSMPKDLDWHLEPEEEKF
jgi:tRNA(His) guanylyltransferase